jgi:hypothetical protein
MDVVGEGAPADPQVPRPSILRSLCPPVASLSGHMQITACTAPRPLFPAGRGGGSSARGLGAGDRWNFLVQSLMASAGCGFRNPVDSRENRILRLRSGRLCPAGRQGRGRPSPTHIPPWAQLDTRKCREGPSSHTALWAQLRSSERFINLTESQRQLNQTGGWVQWLTSVIPATIEVEIGARFEASLGKK